MSKTEDGYCVIDIQPGLTDDATLSVLCHEIAHARDDFVDVLPNKDWHAEPGSITLSAIGQTLLSSLPRESKADDQAEVWLDYAEKYYMRYQAPTELESKLECLAMYPKEELLDLAREAGYQAGLKLVSYLKTSEGE
jgi:hypothetical protein